MTDHDAMVIRPRLRGDEAAREVDARARAREERREHRHIRDRKKSTVARLMRAKMARKVMRRRNRAMQRRSSMKGARKGLAKSGAGRLIGAVGGGKLMMVAVSLLVVQRLASGQSFENAGAHLNRKLLGDLDDKARAGITVRKRLSADSDLAYMRGQDEKFATEIEAISESMYDFELRREQFRSRVMEDKHFQVNSTLDQLILRARDAFLTMWNASGGPALLEWFEWVMVVVRPAGAAARVVVRGMPLPMNTVTGRGARHIKRFEHLLENK